jgi:hypothetical protein
MFTVVSFLIADSYSSPVLISCLTSDDLRHICEVTSCYSAWRAQEARKNTRSKITSAECPHTDSRSDCDRNATCTAGRADPGSCPVPLDCTAVNEVVVTLQGGYGEVENIILPLDTPPGRYVIEVSDGILPACLRTLATDMTPLGNLNNSSSATVPISTVRCRAALEDMKDLAAVVNPIRANRNTIFNAVSATVSGT